MPDLHDLPVLSLVLVAEEVEGQLGMLGGWMHLHHIFHILDIVGDKVVQAVVAGGCPVVVLPALLSEKMAPLLHGLEEIILLR